MKIFISQGQLLCKNPGNIVQNRSCKEVYGGPQESSPRTHCGSHAACERSGERPPVFLSTRWAVSYILFFPWLSPVLP